jgi:hypothetical protein
MVLRVLGPLARQVLVGVGAVSLLFLAYRYLVQSNDVQKINPEALANSWNDTLSQFGVSPIFPPQEDVRAGDVYAVLGEGNDEIRVPLKAHRAIKMDHLQLLDDKLPEIYDHVNVLPETTVAIERTGSVVAQEPCVDGCFGHPGKRRQLPLVIFPGISLARANQMEASGSWIESVGKGLFGVSSRDSRSITLNIRYAELYGIPSLQASGILAEYCSDKARPKLCTEDNVREQISMIAGKQAFEKQPDSDRYKYPAYVVLVSSVYVTRSIVYGVSADSSAGLQAQAYKNLKTRVENLISKDAAPSGSPPTVAGEKSSTDVAAAKTLDADRTRLLQLVAAAAGNPPGATLDVQSSSSDRVLIDLNLPRPVAIGFIPVLKSFQTPSGKGRISEPE